MLTLSVYITMGHIAAPVDLGSAITAHNVRISMSAFHRRTNVITTPNAETMLGHINVVVSPALQEMACTARMLTSVRPLCTDAIKKQLAMTLMDHTNANVRLVSMGMARCVPTSMSVPLKQRVATTTQPAMIRRGRSTAFATTAIPAMDLHFVTVRIQTKPVS